MAKVSRKNKAYAGFWLRVWAFLIDLLIILGAMGLMWLTYLLGQVLHVTVQDGEVVRESMMMLDILGSFMSFDARIDSLEDMQFGWSGLALWLLYVSTFESCPWQATPGKRLMKIKVTDYEGKKLDFPQALLRNFSKLFSELTLGLGYALAGLTKHKQALQDMVAKCLVVRDYKE